MNSATFTSRHRPINLFLSLAIALLAGWQIVLFLTAPGPLPGYGMSHQEFKVLRYSQVE